MKLGLGLYAGVVTPDNLRFARQVGATCQASWHAGMAWALGYMRAILNMLE